MTTPGQARDALQRAVDNQRAQREAAQETRRVQIPAGEPEVEAAETDRENA